ncbi:actin depolymerizing protein [Serendipita vermifera]|nr:actin depolymerizing protein [Serendipita vermifera]
MANVSGDDISQAYNDVRNDRTETNWLLLDYMDSEPNKLKVTATGNGGLTELKGHLNDSNPSFAYVRISYANDKESRREKFVLIVWIGENVKGIRKGVVSVHLADVKTALRTFSIEVAASQKEDLVEEAIVAQLRKAGGASYDGV